MYVCEEHYILKNGICYRKILYCEQYTNIGECSKCSSGYAFKETDRLNCYDKNQFYEGYYTKDNAISFFKCDDTETGGINQCIGCSYENGELKWNKCSDDYILIDDETNTCHLKTECDNQKCYEVDEFHYYTCLKQMKIVKNVKKLILI